MAKKNNYPRMVYLWETGQQLVCEGPEEVPEGYVSNLRDVLNKECVMADGVTYAEHVKGVKRTREATPGVTLGSLGVSRSEAIEYLRERDEKVPGNISDKKLAARLEPFLEDESDD